MVTIRLALPDAYVREISSVPSNHWCFPTAYHLHNENQASTTWNAHQACRGSHVTGSQDMLDKGHLCQEVILQMW